MCPEHHCDLVPLESGKRPCPGPIRCWNCGEPSASPDNTGCVACGKSLTPPALLLRFEDGGQLTLDPGEQVLLGRDEEQSPHACLFAGHGNVSRRHATVGVDRDGNAWIRDEKTLNGTFVNDAEITSKIPATIADGDTVRLAATLSARVRIHGRMRDDRTCG
jgi:hypothetical protein